MKRERQKRRNVKEKGINGKRRDGVKYFVKREKTNKKRLHKVRTVLACDKRKIYQCHERDWGASSAQRIDSCSRRRLLFFFGGGGV